MQEVFLCYSIPEKLYKNLELLHADLDQYMAYYNFEIPYSNRYCFEKTFFTIF
jgi:hypothetical protein